MGGALVLAILLISSRNSRPSHVLHKARLELFPQMRPRTHAHPDADCGFNIVTERNADSLVLSHSPSFLQKRGFPVVVSSMAGLLKLSNE